MVRIASIPLSAWFLIVTATSPMAEVAMLASPLGFGYCPPPVIPTCIERDAARRRPSREVLDVCSRHVLRFTQSLGTYRLCLTRESERAIGTGNAAISRFRCLAQGGHACP